MQLNPLVSSALSQPLRGSAHSHQHSARCLSLSSQHDKLRKRTTTEKMRAGRRWHGWRKGIKKWRDKADESCENERLIAWSMLITHLHKHCCLLPTDISSYVDTNPPPPHTDVQFPPYSHLCVNGLYLCWELDFHPSVKQRSSQCAKPQTYSQNDIHSFKRSVTAKEAVFISCSLYQPVSFSNLLFY